MFHAQIVLVSHALRSLSNVLDSNLVPFAQSRSLALQIKSNCKEAALLSLP